jgi:hypothetical protein
MTTTTDYGLLRVPRTRGALSGVLLVLLGAWGALIAFIGPYFNYSYRSDNTWVWTSQRGWLEVLPGAVTVLGGLILLMSGSRIGASVGAWLGVAGGVWFVIGRSLSDVLNIGSVGQPTAASQGARAAAELGYFDALGAAIILVAGFALGRLSIVAARDVRGTPSPEPETLPERDGAVDERYEPKAGGRHIEERYEDERRPQPVEQTSADPQGPLATRSGE